MVARASSAWRCPRAGYGCRRSRPDRRGGRSQGTRWLAQVTGAMAACRHGGGHTARPCRNRNGGKDVAGADLSTRGSLFGKSLGCHAFRRDVLRGCRCTAARCEAADISFGCPNCRYRGNLGARNAIGGGREAAQLGRNGAPCVQLMTGPRRSVTADMGLSALSLRWLKPDSGPNIEAPVRVSRNGGERE